MPDRAICVEYWYFIEVSSHSNIGHCIKVNLTSPQISDQKATESRSRHFFVCVTQNTQSNSYCQYVGSQFIASKTQETHSHGNTDSQQFLILYIQTLHNDCSYIEDAHE